MNKIRINQGRIMNGWFRYVATLIVVCSVFGMVIALNNVVGFIIAMALCFLLLLVWTSYYVVEINLDDKMYRDLTSVMGRTWGETVSYPSIEKVFVNEVGIQTAHTVYSTGVRHLQKGTEFKAFLKFTNGDKLFLLSDENYENLTKRLRPALKKMNVQIT